MTDRIVVLREPDTVVTVTQERPAVLVVGEGRGRQGEKGDPGEPGQPGQDGADGVSEDYVDDAVSDGVALARGYTDTKVAEVAAGVNPTLVHNQALATTEAVIEHNFPYPPEVLVTDTAGRQIYLGVTYIDSHHVVLSSTYPTSYTAYLS